MLRPDEYEKFVAELKYVEKHYGIYNVNGLPLYQVIVRIALEVKLRWLQRYIFRLSIYIHSFEEFLRNYVEKRFQK